MKVVLHILLFFVVTEINIAASDLETQNKKRLEKYAQQSSSQTQKRSQLDRKKRKLEYKIQYLRDKMNNLEADASEEAKFLDALEKLEKINVKIEKLR